MDYRTNTLYYKELRAELLWVITQREIIIFYENFRDKFSVPKRR